jgi:hypothetical protein
MGINIYYKLYSKLKKIENFKVFKNKLKVVSYKTVFVLYKSFLVTMIDGRSVIGVSFDMIRKYTDGLCTAIFTECVMFWLTWVFGG